MSKHQQEDVIDINDIIEALGEGFDVEDVADATGAPVDLVQAIYDTYYDY